MMNLSTIKIDETEIYLHDIKVGEGKVTISNTYGYNYSTYFGAMGEGKDLKHFLIDINVGYFCNRFLGRKSGEDIDAKKTFSKIRKHIREEILPWYSHMEFQKYLREELNKFQEETDESGSRFFVDYWNTFINNLDYYLIEDRFDRKLIKDNFKNIDEHWYFIVNKPSEDYIFLSRLFKKLQKTLKKELKHKKQLL